MNLTNVLLAVALVPVALTPAVALSEEKGFITQREIGIDVGNGAMDYHMPDQALRASPSPDEVDPSGGWGQKVDELDMSLRFPNRTFTNGEPIIAYLYLRNSSPTNRFKYPLLVGFGNHSAIADFEIIGPRDKPPALVRSLSQISLRPGFGRALGPRRQDLYLIRLDNIFDLRQLGKYFIRGKRQFSDPAPRVKIELCSNRVQIEIVPVTKPSNKVNERNGSH